MLATDPLSLVFIGCAAFSGVFLVISTLLGAGDGHDFHVGHADTGGHDFQMGHAAEGHGIHSADAHGADAQTHGDVASAQTAEAPSIWTSIGNTLLGTLNLYGVLMFLLIFGLVGYVSHAVLGWGVLFVILIPLLLGVACAIGISTLLHTLFATSKGTVLTATDARLEGRLGTVTMAIRAGGIGEVIFTRKGGGRQSIGARSASGDAVPAGSDVVILDYRDGIASVQSWDTFLAAARAGKMPELAPIEPKSSSPSPKRRGEG